MWRAIATRCPHDRIFSTCQICRPIVEAFARAQQQLDEQGTYGPVRPDEYHSLVVKAGKRLGLLWSRGMADWFVGYSPRNSSYCAEGSWNHWVNLAVAILAHPLTKVSVPERYMPQLEEHFQMGLYTENPNPLKEVEIGTILKRS